MIVVLKCVVGQITIPWGVTRMWCMVKGGHTNNPLGGKTWVTGNCRK